MIQPGSGQDADSLAKDLAAQPELLAAAAELLKRQRAEAAGIPRHALIMHCPPLESLPEPQLPQARLRAVGAQAGLQDEHSRVRGKNDTRHGTCREWRVLGPWGSVVYSYPARAATCECGSRRCVCCCSAARGSGSHCLTVCCAIACRVAGSLCIFARAHKLAPYLHRKSTISSLTVTSQTGSWVAGSRPAVSQNCLKRPGYLK